MSGKERNSGYASGDESAALLSGGKGKPVLIRQDCTTSLSVAAGGGPRLTGLMGASDESTGLPEEARSVPDIEMHCRNRPSHLAPLRCYCERRKSHGMARSVSRESVRSGHQQIGGGPGGNPPPLLLTPSSRIIRQSSQPEACHCCPHHGSASLRQLREPGDGIAMIAADSLRINGAIRQFKQPQPSVSVGQVESGGRLRVRGYVVHRFATRSHHLTAPIPAFTLRAHNTP